MHSESRPILDRAADMASLFGLPTPDTSFETAPLPEAGLLDGLILPLEARFTPGHCPGHVSLYWPEAGVVFAGDALFQESIGRTDLPGGDITLLARSIRERLYTLPPTTRVLPGHGPETTIGHEREFNPFVSARP